MQPLVDNVICCPPSVPLPAGFGTSANNNEPELRIYSYVCAVASPKKIVFFFVFLTLPG